MGDFVIEGGRPLEGSVTIQGAKNSVLPILAATVLHKGTSVLRNCPRLRDVEASVRILRHLGCKTAWDGTALCVDASSLRRCDIPDHLMREMRSSVIFLGSILARCGEAELSMPGGCELGPRPIDLHLSALRRMGAEIEEKGGRLCCRRGKLGASDVVLHFPSVGATENIMLAACGCCGVSSIENAAREPEIADLQGFLRAMGYAVSGAGSSTVTVAGGGESRDCAYDIMSDRIVAATYLAAVAAAGGEAQLRGADDRHLATVISALCEAGCTVKSERDSIYIKREKPLRAIRAVHTAPYPGFPTDAQAVLMAALLRSRGATVFVENMFDNRYRHVDELCRLGAEIRAEGRVAVVSGVERLRGAAMKATDLRGGAAMVTAALAAEGESRVGAVEHIRRGYADMVGDLRGLGAVIREE